MSITLKISEIKLGKDKKNRDTITYTTFVNSNISFELEYLIQEFLNRRNEDMDFIDRDNKIYETDGYTVRKLLETINLNSDETFESNEFYRIEIY